MGTEKKTSGNMTTSEKRAHSAHLSEKKEKNRHNEQNRKIRLNEKQLDIMEATNQLKLEQQNAQWQAEQERKQQLDVERRDRQAQEDAQNEHRNEVNANKQILNAGAGVAKAITPDSGKSSFKVGSLDISWGLFFLLAIVFLWMTVSPAPGHSSSRLGVMWKAFIGQEQIA